MIMSFSFSYSPSGVTAQLLPARSGILGRMFPAKAPDLERLAPSDRRIAFALADLRALADQMGERLEIIGTRLEMSHRLAAALDAEAAHALGLPSFTDLILRTDAEGVLGTPEFRLRVQFLRAGQVRSPRRIGAILETAPIQRLPLWMLEALEIADGQTPSDDDAAHWEALARFRKVLEPGVDMSSDNNAARVSMTDFLQGLEVSLTDRLSISPDTNGDDFEIVPFAAERLEDGSSPSEDMAELSGADLKHFQQRVRERGVLNAYRLGPSRFMVVDRSVAPALQVMADMQRAPVDERRAFIRNPRARITGFIEERLRQTEEFGSLSPASQEEVVENIATPLFVETEEYKRFSDRVIGVEVYAGSPVAEFESSGTTWLPEEFAEQLRTALDQLSTPELETLRANVQAMVDAGGENVPFEGMELPASPALVSMLDERIEKRRMSDREDQKEPDEDTSPEGPIILKTADNFEELQWFAKLLPRETDMTETVPHQISTRLKDHQVESLFWQMRAWKAGLPGILNADEQGLGKTLQTISFLVWLNEHMKRGGKKGPVLVVAPTSLLENWEQEVARHVDKPGLGHLVRLYGSATSARRQSGAGGKDTDTGMARLDFSDITRALEQGAGHLTWVLTTYTTLTNYQHSLAAIPFAAVVFDEIQNIKNPGTLAANAARAVNADFRIGLTGTPIENKTTDLWAVMDPLAAGALGTLREFRAKYGDPHEINMVDLHARIFRPQGGKPPLALRRLKDAVARDLPPKTRYLHPREMPKLQASRYDEAQIKLASGGMGAALKMLHHIRGISVHPALSESLAPEAFIAASARLSATFELLRRIRSVGERALVFIEHRQMQYRFIELAKSEFGLNQINLINGDTPIPKRQAIVNDFQKHLEEDRGFDLLVLGPKAAGTGLTLTAATHVIHLSRWWNPAVEEQCNDRVHRIGQGRPVSVHVPMAVHPDRAEQTFDLLLQSLMQRKRRLASSALWPMGDSSDDIEALQSALLGDVAHKEGDLIATSMLALFQRDGIASSGPDENGAWRYA